MKKMIIENRTDLEAIDVLQIVSNIVIKGRVSNCGTQYCYLTIINNWNGSGKEYQVATDVNKKSDRFIILER